jgi:hypothetical protein
MKSQSKPMVEKYFCKKTGREFNTKRGYINHISFCGERLFK